MRVISPFFFVMRILALAALLQIAGCGTVQQKDAVETATEFFVLLNMGQTKLAYKSAAYGIRAQQTLQTFEATVRDLGLTGYVSLNWTSKAIKENEAKLDGEIVTRKGAKVHVVVTMVKEAGTWRMYSLRTPGEGEVVPAPNRFSLVGKGASFNDSLNRKRPPEAEVRKMVLETLLRFDGAVQKKDFSDFYNSVSISWQAQLSEKRLRAAFQPFIDGKVSIAGVRGVEAVFDTPPQITGDGLLFASGYYPTTPYRVVFSLKYIYELPNWKLFAIDVNLER